METTIPYERRQRILEILQMSEVAFIDDIADQLDTSSSTIRRDVKGLVDTGEVIALRGGAIKVNTHPYELPLTAKTQRNAEAKEQIAAAAAALISEGETIYLDSGTTTLSMLNYLRGRRLNIITTNTQALALLNDPGWQVTLVGGSYSFGIGSLSGAITDLVLKNMFFDKAFIGASGISPKAGLSTFDVREATKKRTVHENSTVAYVLADHSKIGQVTTYKAVDLDQCRIITDRGHEVLSEAAEVIIAPPTSTEAR